MRYFFLLLTALPLIASTPAAEVYFKEFSSLREQEKWEQIIVEGEKTLEGSIEEGEALRIHAHLASTYFYRGDFRECKKHASACYELAIQPDEKAHALYLLSAASRGLGDFAQAKEYAIQALPFSEGEMRAKVFFNWGAAEADDPHGNLQTAKEAFDEALALFACPEDQQRTAIRLGKVHLLLGEIDQAKQAIANLSIQSERIQMHSDYLAAQIENVQGHIEEARRLATLALEKANQLGAKKDAERIQNLLNSL